MIDLEKEGVNFSRCLSIALSASGTARLQDRSAKCASSSFEDCVQRSGTLGLGSGGFTEMKSKKVNAFNFVGPFVGLAIALSGCTTHVRDDAALTGVKRVAIVAFSAFEPVSASLTGNNTAGVMDQGSLEELIEPSVDQMMNDMSAAFAKKMSWTMMNSSAIKKNAGFQEAYQKTMTGFQNKMPPGKGRIQYVAKDMLDFDAGRILREKGREDLIQKLGVDAIVVVRIDVVLNGTVVMGIGARHPQANVSFNVYEKGKPKPIWFEGKIEGVETDSVGKTAFIDEDLLHKYAMKSAYTAFQKIGDTPAK